jgi:hypothetical protein
MILAKNDELKTLVARKLIEMQNECNFPDYMKEWRLEVLAKEGSNQEVKVENIRPIEILSHARKFIEKAVIN